MMKATMKLLLILLLVIAFPMIGSAEGRTISKAYPFSSDGSLKIPLAVEFVAGIGTPIKASIQPTEIDQRELSVAINYGNEVFAVKMNKSLGYVFYKEKTRNAEHEELIIFGYTKLASNRYQIEEVIIVGVDNSGKLSSLKINNFKPAELIRAPLQKNVKGELILALSAYRSGKTTLKIGWQAQNDRYQCSTN